MREQDLQIHLRRRYVEQAQARRPRLPQRLRALGAVGPVVRPLPATSRQAFVKVLTTGPRATGSHLYYLQHQKGLGKEDVSLFGPAASDKERFVQEAQQDRHQFRLVLMVREHRHLDLTRYAELFMAQVEQDLSRPLDWMAAHHFDTQHPHTHIVIRGRDCDGKDLYMERDYYSFGLRARAAHILTWLLGPQRQHQQFLQSDRQAFDGIPRGLDDPDTRGRVQQSIAAVGPDDDRPTRAMAASTDALRSPAEVLAPYRGLTPGSAAPQASVTPVPIAAAPVVLDTLAARVAAMQQALQYQAQAMQRGQGMGF